MLLKIPLRRPWMDILSLLDASQATQEAFSGLSKASLLPFSCLFEAPFDIKRPFGSLLKLMGRAKGPLEAFESRLVFLCPFVLLKTPFGDRGYIFNLFGGLSGEPRAFWDR